MRSALLIGLLSLPLLAASDGARQAAARAEAEWKARRYQQANEAFKAAVALDPEDPALRVRWGRLFLERFNAAEADQLFEEALKIKPDYPPAVLGLAMVAADAYDKKAVELAEKALKLDPSLTEAHQLLARLALEDGDLDRAREQARQGNLPGVLAVADWLQDKTPGQVPTDAETYALAGHIFVINRRYEEGIRYYRKAVEIDPELYGARSELGVNLMRQGREQEGREQLEKAYAGGYRDAATVNTLRLMDSFKKFNTRQTPTTIVRLDKKEADLLGPYVESELKRAIATYNKKYNYKLAQPVQLEVYPDHEDFVVKTLGLPGMGGILGVTFGYVVAMDSPSSRKPGSFHWSSTLWHELSHVYVLNMTAYRVPRWFTEGMSVYEETAVSPDWGDRLDPHVIDAIQKKKLLPVAELDSGFLRPSYPTQVNVSYFQAGKICSFIAEKWGYEKLQAMIRAYAARETTPQVIEQQLGMKPSEFDVKFLAWLDTQVGKTVANYPEWKKGMRSLTESAKAKNYDQVIKDGPAVRDLYPDYVEDGSAYQLVADAYLARGSKPQAIVELQRYSAAGGRDPETLTKLASLEEEAGQRKQAIATLQRLIYIYPMGEELHRHLGELLMAENQAGRAVPEFEAALAAKPLDQAASRFNLARALRAQNKMDDAREQLLLALEAAPGYKPAQKMLLELSQ